MKKFILSVFLLSAISADEVYFLDGIDDLDIVAKEGWVFVEDSAFVDTNRTIVKSNISTTKQNEPKVELFSNNNSSGCGSEILNKKRGGCKSSR